MINEIFYNAPNDLDDLEYIELHNSGDQAVDLGGWAFTKGIQFKFSPGTRIEAKGFLVLCRDRQRFKQFYDVPIAGVFEQRLSHKSKRIELCEARGRVVDGVKYQDDAPWPIGADGLSGSLERICPEAAGDNPSNWASSPLSEDRIKPAGSPGKVNACYSAHLPPAIASVTFAPEIPAPDQPIIVEVEVSDPNGVSEVKLLYRRAGPGFETPDAPLPMMKTSASRYSATIPGQPAEQLIRFRIEAISTLGARRLFPSQTEPRPALSSYVRGRIEPADIPFAWILNTTPAEFNAAQHRARSLARAGSKPDIFGGEGRGGAERFKATTTGVPSSQSALVFFDPATAEWHLFDFVQVAPHRDGLKVHFAKGQMLQQMSVVHLMFSDNERSMLAEPLAYEIYRSAGMAAPQCYHVRLSVNGQPAGYHLLAEQPNRAFLHRHHLSDDGNLYRVHGSERGVVRQHEKKTNTRAGHEDIVALVDALDKSQGEACWEIIRRHFDVEEVANYFALCTILSDWDGFSNNYFTYHDTRKTGKWTVYPWDQDQTWGIIGRAGPADIFYNLPITFGMEGDLAPPQSRPRGPGPGSDQDGPEWWQPGGCFSRPLLANPRFRKLFLVRTREILEKSFTEEFCLPRILAMGERLKPEVELRAQLRKSNPAQARQNLEQNLQSLRHYLRLRREFLLAQDEVKNAAQISSAELGTRPAKH